MASAATVSQSSLQFPNLVESEENREYANNLDERIAAAVRDIPMNLSDQSMNNLKDITRLILDRALKSVILQKLDSNKGVLVETLEKVIIQAVQKGLLQSGIFRDEASLVGGSFIYRENYQYPLFFSLRSNSESLPRQVFLFYTANSKNQRTFDFSKFIINQQTKTSFPQAVDQDDAKSPEGQLDKIVKKSKELGGKIKALQQEIQDPDAFRRRSEALTQHVRKTLEELALQVKDS